MIVSNWAISTVRMGQGPLVQRRKFKEVSYKYVGERGREKRKKGMPLNIR
jgi:hypothetical protein